MKNKNSAKATFDDATDQMLQMKQLCERIEGFNFPESIMSRWSGAASLLKDGKEDDATREAFEAIKGLKTIMSAFFRNAPERHFKPRIEERSHLDQDIVGGLRKKFGALEEATRVETNGVFTMRIEAYAVLKAALRNADEEWKRREDNRARVAAEERKKERERQEAETAERNRKVAEEQRQKAIAARLEKAQRALDIFA